MRVGAEAGLPEPAEGDAEPFVERTLLVGTRLTFSQARVQGNVLGHFYANVAAESLEQILVQQAGSDEPRIESWQIAEIVMVDAKSQATYWLEMQGGIALRNACGIATAIWQRRFARFICLKGIVEGYVALP